MLFLAMMPSVRSRADPFSAITRAACDPAHIAPPAQVSWLVLDCGNGQHRWCFVCAPSPRR
jgi:hypothetical protein